MKSKVLSLFLIFVLVCSALSISVLAAGFDAYPDEFEQLEKSSVILVVETPNAAKNMKKTLIDPDNPNVMPQIINGRTLVPVRFVAQSVNAMVSWEEATRTATIRRLDTRLELIMDNQTMLVNGEPVQLDAAPQIIESRTMVPLRAIVEALGKQVFWDPKGLIVISDSADLLDSEKDSAFIDVLIEEIRKDGEITRPVFGGVFDQKKVDEVVDFDKVEQPYYTREGLPNVREKIQKNEAVKVAYLGGSITEMTGYRTMTDAWLRDSFKNAKFEPLNAGVGGTGSKFGVTRLGTDVLSFQPDLLFVEFAVNDSDANDDLGIVKSMEGIVRQCWNSNPNMDIVFVYTIRESDLKTASEGKYSHSSKIHDYIANHYGIPSIYMGYQVAKEAVAGELIFNSSNPGDAQGPTFSSDGVHPNAYGSEAYMNALRPFYKALLSETEAPSGAVAHELKHELYSKNLGNLKTLAPDVATLSKSFRKIDSNGSAFQSIWASRADYAYSADKVGESITIKFTGRQAGILYLTGPDAPCLDISIDGEPYQTGVSIFDAYHGVKGYYIGSYMTPVLSKGEHTLTISVSEKKEAKLQAIQKTGYNLNDHIRFYEANEEWFSQSNLIVGKILVDGELLS